MLTAPQYHALRERILKVAQRDTNTLLKSLPADFKQRLASVPKPTIRFEDRHARDKTDHRARVESLSTTHRDTGEIVIYFMTIFEQHGDKPGVFTQALQQVILQALADWAGLEIDLVDD